MKLMSDLQCEKLVASIADESMMALETAHVVGNTFALPQALLQCCKDASFTPEWVLFAAHEALIDLLFATGGKSRGRNGNIAARMRQNLVHWIRYCEVEEILEGREAMEASWKEWKATKTLTQKSSIVKQERLSSYKARLQAIGEGESGVHETARRFMVPWGASGSPDAIRKSHSLVYACPLRFQTWHRALPILLGLPSKCFERQLVNEHDRLFFAESYKPPRASAKASTLRSSPRRIENSASFDPRSKPSTAGQSGSLKTEVVAKGRSTDKGPRGGVREQRLERAVLAGSFPALLEGLRAFAMDRRAAPQWLLLQAFKTLVALVRQPHLSTRGKLGNPAARCRAEITHFVRVEMVREILELQAIARKLNTGVGKSRKPDLGQLKRDLKLMALSVGKTKMSAFRAAAMRLRESPWAGDPEAIKKSFQLFSRDKALCERFWIPGGFQRESVGIPGVWDCKTGKEFAELFPERGF